jgi:hypothetical protein
VNREHPGYADCAAFAEQLAFVYRQEIFEILNLYGLSHESDLWCRNSINGLTGEFEDTAYTELEQLVNRTQTNFFYGQIEGCTKKCNQDTPISNLCLTCKIRQQAIAVACYSTCYSREDTLEHAPILSLPWLFATPLLQNRINQESPRSSGLLSTAMEKALDSLVRQKRRLRLNGLTLQFKTSGKNIVGEADVDVTVCGFIEVLQECIGSKKCPCWPLILSRFVRHTSSFELLSREAVPTNEWKLVLQSHKTNEYDEYAGFLLSIMSTETEDKLMHDYFQDIIDICFEEGRRTNDIDYLNVSEHIILLLQKMAIKETII